MYVHCTLVFYVQTVKACLIRMLYVTYTDSILTFVITDALNLNLCGVRLFDLLQCFN